jgi:hypothetical protein
MMTVGLFALTSIAMQACGGTPQGSDSAAKGKLLGSEAVVQSYAKQTPSLFPDVSGVDTWDLDLVQQDDASSYLVGIGYKVDPAGQAAPTDVFEFVVDPSNHQIGVRKPSGEPITITVDQWKAIAADFSALAAKLPAPAKPNDTGATSARLHLTDDSSTGSCAWDAAGIAMYFLLASVTGTAAVVACTGGQVVIGGGLMLCGASLLFTTLNVAAMTTDATAAQVDCAPATGS